MNPSAGESRRRTERRDQMVRVSVIVPVYNVEPYLRECLDSILGQSLKEIEIICVNDGSTDSSPAILEEYAGKDPSIQLISQENGGYGKAMNRGLEAAQGEYIGIVEPDDYVDLDMFRDLYEIAQKQDLDFVKADFFRFTKSDDGARRLEYEPLDLSGHCYNQVFNPSQTPSAIRFTMNTWSGIYRRRFLNQNEIRHHETPGASFQDNGFFFQTFIYGKRAMIVNHPYYYNRRDNPNSSVRSKEKVYCMNIEYDYIQDILKRDPEIWNRFKYMYWWKKYYNYMFTLNRIDTKYKEEFLVRMGMEYKRAIQQDEIQASDFTKAEWEQIQMIVENSRKYYRQYIDLPAWTKPLQRIAPSPVKKIAKWILRRV